MADPGPYSDGCVGGPVRGAHPSGLSNIPSVPDQRRETVKEHRLWDETLNQRS